MNAIHPAGISTGVRKFWAEVKDKMCFAEKGSGNEFPDRKNLVDFKTIPRSTASFYEEG